jgi:type I restriction enzyme M protein
MNGAYCETRFVPNNKELILNGEEVRELVREKEALEFLNAHSNEAWTIPQEVKVSRDELISQFRNLNDVLRSEGLRAGIERFSEFANILFLKLLSEDSQKSWWNSIKSQSNDDIVGYINGYVIEQIQNKYGGDVFTPISIKNPQTLRHIIDAIDPLILSTIDTDIKGDAFEYFLEKTTSTENDLGEYFTPRNVVKTIINLVDPKFKESVYDPFCGTGGFLTEAFNYIKENNIIEGEKDLKRLKHNTLYGREITTTARIAKMNMVLHGDGHSGIQQINTLTNPDYLLPNGEIKKFDVIVTNMPFSQTITRKTMENGKTKTENNISPLYYNGIAKNSGDSACVLHCFRALKEGGRMALVVPEGFLFRRDTAAVRKFLLSKAKLQSIISLPQGAFLPYTGVKTDILYFTDAHKPNNQKNYWFFEAKNIGVTLDNHKRKIKGDNDLKKIESSDIKKVDKKPDLQDNMLEIGFEIVDMEKVKNNDYNLIGSYYREIAKSSKYNMVSLLDILLTLETGSRPKGGVSGINKGAISLGGEQIGNDGKLDLSKIPFVSMEFYQKAKRGFVKDKDILVCKDGALTGKVCMVDFDLLPQKEVMTNEHAYILRGNSNLIKQSFLFHCLNSPEVQLQIKNLAYNKSAQPGLNRDHIKKIQIPLPSIEEQKKIVDLIQKKEKEIQVLKEKIEANKQSISEEIKQVWQSEGENELIADKSVFDMIINKASKPSQ